MDQIEIHTIVLLTLIAVFLPFLSFVLNILFIKSKKLGGYIGIACIGLSTIASIVLFLTQWNNTPLISNLPWFSIGKTVVSVGLFLNNLSVLMLLLVTFIALLVHIYSTKYMEGDPYINRYWGYLGLFCFAMLGLVVANNLILMYIAWELVGFASYLLIGFWFQRPAAVQANKKAFLVNRIGDIGFLIGIMVVFNQFASFDVNELFNHGGLVDSAKLQSSLWLSGAHAMPAYWQSIAGIAFFIGAVAKSAQFPLHVWLPDAMEGPTAVSSLIHAATMVAAGVFLLARVYPLFNPDVLMIIACVGTFTAFIAGTIALVQNDIKRILAFSTISQLGYMIMAIGIGAQTAAIFHLVTHAFFKCLLFLGAGAVIHEMAHVKNAHNLSLDTQDIRVMGGLRKRMPVTFFAMLIGGAALAGLPFTSGFLSKDAILLEAFAKIGEHNSWFSIIPILGVLTSWMTAFYMARLLFKVFFGQFRLEKMQHMQFHIHEAPLAMRVVLMILPIFCLFVCFSLNPFSGEHAWLAMQLFAKESVTEVPHILHVILPVTITLGSLVGIYLAYRWYANREAGPDYSQSVLYRIAENQWFIDAFYIRQVVPIVVKFAKGLFIFDRSVVDGAVNRLGVLGLTLSSIAKWMDRNIIDGIVNGIAWMANAVGRAFRKYQDGHLQHYYLCMLILILALFIYKYITATI